MTIQNYSPKLRTKNKHSFECNKQVFDERQRADKVQRYFAWKDEGVKIDFGSCFDAQRRQDIDAYARHVERFVCFYKMLVETFADVLGVKTIFGI